MYSAPTNTAVDQEAHREVRQEPDAERPDDPGAPPRLPHQTTPDGTTTGAAYQDPRAGWSAAAPPPAPVLRHRRDGILPNVAAALSVQGSTFTGTAARGDQAPALHPLVQDFFDALTSNQRDRFTGRCAEALVISRQLDAVDAVRSKRAQRKSMTNSEARKALKNARLTARRIREDGDPLHGSFAGPCRACAALAAHFGIRVVNPATQDG